MNAWILIDRYIELSIYILKKLRYIHFVLLPSFLLKDSLAKISKLLK